MNVTKLTLTLLLSATVVRFTAPSLAAAEDPATHKKLREEFQQAERVLNKTQANAEAAQQDLDRLTRERKNWEGEVIHYKGAVAYAQAQVEHYEKISAQEQVRKWTAELDSARNKLTASEAQLKTVDSQIRAVIQRLQSSMKGPEESNLILPGENIEVMILEDESLNGLYLVRRGGYIIMKNVGRIQVAGKDFEGAEKAIKEELQKDQIKDAHVTVDRPERAGVGDSAVIYLAGEFRTPAPFKIPPGVAPTVVTTILRSGGVTQSADLTRVRVLRLVSGQGLVEEVNVQAIMDGVGLTSDMALNPGDIIMIPAFANVVYVTGNVVRPGVLKLLPDDELTAYTAILRSGGFARFANRKKVYILRDRGNGEKQRIPINIKSIGHDGADIIVEPKDIIVVPEKFFSF